MQGVPFKNKVEQLPGEMEHSLYSNLLLTEPETVDSFAY